MFLDCFGLGMTVSHAQGLFFGFVFMDHYWQGLWPYVILGTDEKLLCGHVVQKMWSWACEMGEGGYVDCWSLQFYLLRNIIIISAEISGKNSRYDNSREFPGSWKLWCSDPKCNIAWEKEGEERRVEEGIGGEKGEEGRGKGREEKREGQREEGRREKGKRGKIVAF